MNPIKKIPFRCLRECFWSVAEAQHVSFLVASRATYGPVPPSTVMKTSYIFGVSIGGRKKLIKSINNKFILFLAFHISIKPEAIRRVRENEAIALMGGKQFTMIALMASEKINNEEDTESVALSKL